MAGEQARNAGRRQAGQQSRGGDSAKPPATRTHTTVCSCRQTSICQKRACGSLPAWGTVCSWGAPSEGRRQAPRQLLHAAASSPHVLHVLEGQEGKTEEDCRRGRQTRSKSSATGGASAAAGAAPAAAHYVHS
jgi:hypothetical protein